MIEEILAYHEAGHAVVAFVRKERIFSIALGDSGGMVRSGTKPLYFFDPDAMSDGDWFRVQSKALILVAGEAAERAFNELLGLDCHDEYYSAHDQSALRDLLEKFGEHMCPPPSINMSLCALKSDTDFLVNKHWDQIEALAKALEIRRVMSAQEAVKVIVDN